MSDTTEATFMSARVRAHSTAVKLSVPDLVKYLQEVLGQKLVAYIAGNEDSKAVSAWADGSRTPRAGAEERLRIAYQVFHLLQAQESPHTVRAWFIGLNPQLADESPATAIRNGEFQDVFVAARAFLSGG